MTSHVLAFSCAAQGLSVSGVSCSFGALDDATDEVDFDDGSPTFAYQLQPGIRGQDANVTDFRCIDV